MAQPVGGVSGGPGPPARPGRSPPGCHTLRVGQKRGKQTEEPLPAGLALLAARREESRPPDVRTRGFLSEGGSGGRPDSWNSVALSVAGVDHRLPGTGEMCPATHWALWSRQAMPRFREYGLKRERGSPKVTGNGVLCWSPAPPPTSEPPNGTLSLSKKHSSPAVWGKFTNPPPSPGHHQGTGTHPGRIRMCEYDDSPIIFTCRVPSTGQVLSAPLVNEGMNE